MAHLRVFSKFFTQKNACQQYVKIGYKEYTGILFSLFIIHHCFVFLTIPKCNYCGFDGEVN